MKLQFNGIIIDGTQDDTLDTWVGNALTLALYDRYVLHILYSELTQSLGHMAVSKFH